MNLNNSSLELYNQLLLILQNPYLRKQPFYNKFEYSWKKILEENIKDPITSLSNVYEDDSQIFLQKIILDSGFCFNLRYDIYHIQAFFRKEQESKMRMFFYPCVLQYKNEKGVLYFGNNKCEYEHYDYKNSEGKNRINTPPFISYLPLVPRIHTLIDGNHRVSASINQGEKQIHGYLIRPDYTPLFLMSSDEMAAYSFLMDVCCILENSNKNVKDNLAVFNPKSALSILQDKGRMN